MKTSVCEMFGIEVPIFAFSHCRDVVVEVSKAGGLGVLGVGYYTAEQLEVELKWIDDHIGGLPYGVDLLMPNNADAEAHSRKVRVEDLPQEQVQFIRKVLDDAGIPRLPEGDNTLQDEISHITMTKAESLACLEVALKHPIKLVVNALGTPPKEMVDRCHGLGIKVGSLVGKVEHAKAQVEAGVDLLVAQGSEAGGHTGTISSMILWPSVVDAVAPIPVLGAGGIGRGRHMAAALALGCDGIWCGSIWLGTKQSDLLPEMKELLYSAKAEQSGAEPQPHRQAGPHAEEQADRGLGTARRRQVRPDAVADHDQHRTAPADRARPQQGLPDLPRRPDRRRHEGRTDRQAGDLRHTERVCRHDGTND